MSQKKTSGPCGHSFAEIIAMADRFGAKAATFGLTDPQHLNTFFSGLGDALTSELTVSGQARDTEEYVHRATRVATELIDIFAQTELWTDCAELGPYSGPLPEEVGLREAVQAFFHSFCSMRKVVGASASDLLDLLAWIHSILGVRSLPAQFPHLAKKCDPATAPMQS
ncbi:MAG: hypothetical protein ACKVLA_16440 [Rhodobacterales bacterium]